MLAVVGVAVLIVAVVALRDPKSDSASDAGTSVAISDTASTPSTSPTSPPASSTAPTTTASTTAPTTAPPVNLSGSGSATPDPKSTPLIVLNNTTISGLAGQAAQRFEAGGWTVTSSGNLANSIISTCAYYDPDTNGAKAAATALQAQYPTIKRVEPRFAELPSGPVVVVLTPDYASD